MAERLRSWPGYDTKADRRFARMVYPYDKWFDGSVWELTRGVDFESRPEVFRTTVTQCARRRGLMCRTTKRGDKLIVQVYE